MLHCIDIELLVTTWEYCCIGRAIKRLNRTRELLLTRDCQVSSISSMVVVVPSLLISYGLCIDLVSPRVEIRPKKF